MATHGDRTARHLAATDFSDGAGQGVLLVLDPAGLVAITKPVNRTLDGAQGFAATDSRLGANDLITQIANALGQSIKRRLFAVNAGVAVFNLIEQGYQFAAQCLPLARLGVTRPVGQILK